MIDEQQNHECLKLGDRVLFSSVPRNHYFMDYYHVWRSVRSGDVMASLAPEMNIMQYVKPLTYTKEKYPDKVNGWKENQLSIDYFKSEFTYIGDETVWEKLKDKI